MADIRWVGGATATAQVDTFTLVTVDTGNILTLTVTGENGDTHAVNYTCAGSNEDTEAEGLVAAWNASTHYLVTPITATDTSPGGTLTLTADTAGVPFTVVGSATGGTAGLSGVNTTPSSGPYDWNITENWLDGAKPVSADVIRIEDGIIRYGMDQTAVTSGTMIIDNSELGFNPQAGTKAPYLRIGLDEVNINTRSGPGNRANNGPIMIDTGTTAGTDVLVKTSGTNATSTLPSVWLKMNNTSASSITMFGGTVGYGYDNDVSGDSSRCAVIDVKGGTMYAGKDAGIEGSAAELNMSGGSANMQFLESPTATTSTIRIDAGSFTLGPVTDKITSINVNGGTVDVSAPIETCNIRGGTLTLNDGIGGSATASTTINVYGGTFNIKSTGAITNLNMYGGTTDTTLNNGQITLTNPRIQPGATLKYQPLTVLFGAGGILEINTADARYFTWTVT
jgi:hypothetical protein